MKHATVLALRPPVPDLDPAWSATTLQAIVDPDVSTYERRRRRPAALVLAAAAVAAVAVVAVPSLDSGDAAAAADLRALSLAAVGYDGPVLDEGTWLHERSVSLQRNNPDLGDGAVLNTRRETWTRWDGRVLLVEQRPSEGWTTYTVLDDDAEPSWQSPTPEFAVGLPDDPDGLLDYLDARVFGSTSHSEALFEALTSLATSHTLPPETLAAAWKVLAGLDHVRTTDVTVAGRPAVEVAYVEDATSSTDSVTVDRATGQVLSTTQESRQSVFTSTTTTSEVVSAVPADVLRTFREREQDVRYDAAGEPLSD